MGKAQGNQRFLFCLNNKGYAASLETRKIYRGFQDDVAEAKGFVRVVDELGEDYLSREAIYCRQPSDRGAAGVDPSGLGWRGLFSWICS